LADAPLKAWKGTPANVPSPRSSTIEPNAMARLDMENMKQMEAEDPVRQERQQSELE
jgi:hypothetical protein